MIYIMFCRFIAVYIFNFNLNFVKRMTPILTIYHLEIQAWLILPGSVNLHKFNCILFFIDKITLKVFLTTLLR